MKQDDLVRQVRTVRLEPGDILAVCSNQKLSAVTAARVADYLRRLVPEGVKIAVLDQGLGLVRVTRAPEGCVIGGDPPVLMAKGEGILSREEARALMNLDLEGDSDERA